MNRMAPSSPRSRKSPNAADRQIASNIRALRIARGLSQGELGRRIGVSFQQVQKYENGSNRVGAVRLAQIAATFDVPVAALFEGIGNRTAQPVPLRRPITDPLAFRAAQCFAEIADRPLRRALIAVLERAAVLCRAIPATGR